MKRIKLFLVLLGLLCLGVLQKGIAQNCQVEFLSAKEISSGFFLEWKFPKDVSSVQFILERSTPNQDFKPIEIFSDFQNSLIVDPSFTFIDSHMKIAKAIYRIKFIREDQSFFYSQEIPIVKKVINTFRVAGQELMGQGVFRVTIECSNNRDLEFILIDEAGEEVMKNNWEVKIGLNDFYINLDYFNDGAYSAFIRKNKEYQSLTFNKVTKKSNQVAMKNKLKN